MTETEICKTIMNCEASQEAKLSVLRSFQERKLISYEALLNHAPFSLLTPSERNEKLHSHYEAVTGNRGPQ